MDRASIREDPIVGTYIVSVAGKRFSVPEGQISALRDRLTEAARSGGTFVAFDFRGQTVDVLVTPGLPVVIERLADPEADDSPELAAAGASLAESVAVATYEFDDWGI